MKRNLLFSLLMLCALLLCACTAQQAAPVESDDPTLQTVCEPDHTHAPPEADNILPHDEVGYCGNMTAAVKAADWEASFWGSDAVTLSDLLRWLDYSEDVCRCVPEYTVTTELSETPYDVNLTEGFVRHENAQVSLTDDQIETVRAILDRAEAGENT